MKKGFGINVGIYSPVQIIPSRVFSEQEWIEFVRERNMKYRCQSNHQIMRVYTKRYPDAIVYDCFYFGTGKAKDEFYFDLWRWMKTLPEAFPENGVPLEENSNPNTRNI